MCLAEGPHSSPSDCEQRGSENCAGLSAPILPDDEVFLEEAPWSEQTTCDLTFPGALTW